ncbi:hypothetical protein C2G38_2069768 [Gigaspora rosea]|uniref:Uncharacterized protein n=1 Tax=Gigaspora rosea TaxID=44941 RepID=A0A397VRD9_9GLOM|nr:hypothetical protein C2G38_2069768 [Gigaspora rosea]
MTIEDPFSVDIFVITSNLYHNIYQPIYVFQDSKLHSLIFKFIGNILSKFPLSRKYLLKKKEGIY